MIEQHHVEALCQELGREPPATHGVIRDHFSLGPAARHVVANERTVARIVIDQ